MPTLKRKVTLRTKVKETDTPIASPPPPSSPTPPPTTSSRSRWAWVFALGLVGVAVGGYYLWDSRTTDRLVASDAQDKELLEVPKEDDQATGYKEDVHAKLRQDGDSSMSVPSEEVATVSSQPAMEAEEKSTTSTKGDKAVPATGAIASSPSSGSLPSSDATTTRSNSSTPRAVSPVQKESNQGASSARIITNTKGHITCFFAFDSDRVELGAELSDFVMQVKNSSSMVCISSYADSTGDEQYNQVLSQRRAESLLRVLTSLGLPSERIQIKACGETEQFGSQENNRRADLTIL